MQMAFRAQGLHCPGLPTQCYKLQIDALPVASVELERVIQKDPLLSKVLYYTRTRWPNAVKEPFRAY